MPDDFYNYGDDTSTMPTDTGSDETFGQTVTLPAFNVTDTKVADDSDMGDTGPTADDFFYNAEGPGGEDLGNSIADFFSGIFNEAKKAASNVAKQAISTAQQRATQSMNQSRSTTTNTATTTNRTTILGLTATQALLAVAGVGLLVYFASRSRGAAATA